MISSIMELMPSVLKILADADPHNKKDIDKTIAAEFGVTESEMKEKISCGANKFKNRMGWALINLRNKGLISKEGREYRITETGVRAVNTGESRLTAKFVKSLNKSDNDSDDTPKGAAGGGSPKAQRVTESEQAAPSAGESAEYPEPENETADAAGALPVSLSEYAGLDPEIEFMLAVRAKIGDKVAFKKLWEKYRSMMVGMFRFCKNLSIDERVSESALVFVRKLELFRPEKIGKAPEAWTFSYMLTGGVKNARDKIIRHSRKEAKYDFDFDEEIADYDNPNPNFSVVGKTLPVTLDVNKFDYEEKYNPEIHAMRSADTSLEDKERALMEKLSPLQITILQLRQAGKTVQEIADEMGCGFTKVRLNIVKARELASSIFDVSYC
jgi:DNA-directed RNA polymerase specialized sigma24 family protein